MGDLMAEIHTTDNGQLLRGDMTLRDYFAGQAMQGLWGAFNRDWHNPNDYQIKVVARNAYVVADAMMEARK